MEVTRSELIRSRNIWHSLAVLPPATRRDRVKSTADQKDSGVVRARIYEIEEEIRLKREFEL